LRHFTGEHATGARKTDHDERKFAALRQQERDLCGDRKADAESAACDQQDDALDRQQSHDREKDEADIGPDRNDVDGHSNGDEE